MSEKVRKKKPLNFKVLIRVVIYIQFRRLHLVDTRNTVTDVCSYEAYLCYRYLLLHAALLWLFIGIGNTV